MPQKIRYIFFLLLCSFFLPELNGQPSPQSIEGKGQINIKLKNIQLPRGSIMLALYNSSKNFMDSEKATALQSFKVTNKDVIEITLKGIEYGEYAIAIFHDENDNEKLETNFFGIPTEPYCFSGSGHSKWRPPVYDDAKFSVSENGTNLSLRLEKWKL